MSLYKFLPCEIVNHFIIPFIPSYGLSRPILLLQKKKIKLIKYIQNLLSFDNITPIKLYILSHYQGELDFCYEDENSYFYCNLRNQNDFIYLIN